MRLRTTMSATLVVAILALFGAAPAAAEPNLPIERFSRIVTDPGTGNVYVSSSTSNAVIVFDAGGSIVTTLLDLDGAAGMVVSGDTLYVALWKDQSIVAIDTRTLTERRRYPTGAGTCPGQVTAAGAVVWFSYGCNSTWGLGIGSLDLGSATVRLARQGSTTIFGAVYLDAADTTLAAGMMGGSRLYVFDITGTDLRLRTEAAYDAAGSNLRQVALNPDGSRVFVASGAPYEVQEASTVDLSVVRAYPTGSGPSSVVLAPGGQFLAAGINSSTSFDVAVFPVGGSAPVWTYDFGTQGGLEEPNRTADFGLAWSPDRDRIYAVTVNAYNENPTLNVLYPFG